MVSSVPVPRLKGVGFRDAVGLPGTRTRPSLGLFDEGRSIDRIFLAGELKSGEGQVHSNVRASDHFPVSMILSARSKHRDSWENSFFALT